MTPSENHISAITASLVHMYLIAGTRTGQLIIWDLSTDYKQVHLFKSHSVRVTSIEFSPNQPNLLISVSNDGVVKFNNIVDFTEMYSFDLHLRTSKISFIDASLFACFMEDNSIGIYEL